MPSKSEPKNSAEAIKGIVADQSTGNTDKDSVKVMLIGSGPGIKCVAKDLHQLGFADVGDWSKAQPYPNSGQSMSVLTKRRQG